MSSRIRPPETRSGRAQALLRAEWFGSGQRERATATALCPASVFVITDSLPAVGERMELFLSFGGRGSWGVIARVSHVHLTVEPGSPAGFRATFEDDDTTRAAVSALIGSTTKESAAPRRTVRVLHCESSKLLRDMFGYALKKYFSTRAPMPILEQVEDLAGAASVLDKGRLDVAIVDHDLLDATGEEVVRYVRARVGRRCWIVGVGLGGANVRARMLDAGADVYLQKPIVLPELLASIELVTHQGQQDAVA